jgi:two-component system response regulator NreC
MPIRIFIVGDDTACQELKTMLADTTGIEIVGEDCSSSGVFFKLNGESLPDLVIVRLGTPERDLEQFRKLKQEFATMKVLLLTAHNQENCLTSLLCSGAEGYAAQHPLREDLLFAVKKIAAGGIYIDPEFTLDLLAIYKSATDTNTYPVKKDLNITEREMDVLALVAKGYTNTEMAKQLFTSVRTIETRRKNLLEKTSTTNTATLIRFAILNKLIR